MKGAYHLCQRYRESLAEGIELEIVTSAGSVENDIQLLERPGLRLRSSGWTCQ